jgi:asparagine synthase (glutamine-hydrolysing)
LTAHVAYHMCGIAGKLDFDPTARVRETEILSMLRPIAHRGPDGQGVFLDGEVGLGHRRLSIIDLSTGTQPMANEDKTIWIVFNGEIYNFQELRDRLLAKGHVFRSRSDTEVIIHLYEEHGPECVRHLRGMFAFAIWDASRRRLFVARDRVGIKPLYYYLDSRCLLFGSEIKAILADPSVPREVHLPAVRTFLAFYYVPGEETLLRGVHKLLPGHYLLAERGSVSIRQYWDLKYTRDRWSMPFEAASEELRSLLSGTVRDHMIADVPVGILLSGGVDSTAVLSFAVQATGKQIKTFTVGFDGGQVVDERPYARIAAEEFGTEHHEISITSKDFWDFLPSYVRHMEEPVHEPPAVALYYVSKLARQHVKVVLSGEGGDEAFAGYPNYPNMLRLERIQSACNGFSRPLGAAAQALGSVIGDERVQRYGYALGRPLQDHYFSRTSGPTSFFNHQARRLFSPALMGSAASSSPSAYVAGLLQAVPAEPLLNRMLYVDTKTWLPDDLLIKADKITMANSLELRVPLLDHVVLEFAASLPPAFKVAGSATKRLLKATFSKMIPPEVLKRKKAGFPVPYDVWLRDSLKSEVRDLLLCKDSVSRGYFQQNELERLVGANGTQGSYSTEIFCLLTLELWHREFLHSPGRKGDFVR